MPGMIRLVRVAAVTLVAVAVGSGWSTLASAEGSLQSNINSWATGRESRSWNDRNGDDWVTALEMKYCSSNAPSPAGTFNLYRELRGRPDPKYGERSYGNACRGNRMQRGQWGDQRSGKYHFTLVKIYGSGSPPSWYRFSAGWMQVHY
ncbi:hypothetical protein AGRA3207_005874 [Actinomadura graeca]|uniref:Secreted protein n=1 Tax=Actinomadura graeca TaxID=2750812 RepID=A0ABX8R0C2_9ACTN|nr:hypothetical protein [Actinomadura graeca]QXJ24535.1 hypothetical protein AGRA3207_005874 [Actinomadura graeca]